MDRYNYLFIQDGQVYGVDAVSSEEGYLDLSSDSWIAKKLSMFNVKAEDGTSVYDMWKELDKIKKDGFVDGLYEYVYIQCLTEEQLKLTLSVTAVTDSIYNNIRLMRSIISASLLYKQRKIDYLFDIDKFLYWYWANCSYIVRWIDGIND